MGIPSGLREKTVMKMLTGWRPVAAEVVRNANGKARPLAVVEFMSDRFASNALASYTNEDYPKLVLKPLGIMTFPGAVGDCCSLQALQFSDKNEKRLLNLDPPTGLEAISRFAPLMAEGGTGKKKSGEGKSKGKGKGVTRRSESNDDDNDSGEQILVNDGPLHHNSVEVRATVTENLNSGSLFELGVNPDDWERFVQEFEFSPSWAQAVEDEHQQLCLQQQPHRKNKLETATTSQPVLLSPEDESEKQKGLRSLAKRKTRLSSTELMNLLNRQQNDGSWRLEAIEIYLNISKDKTAQFLDTCGLKSMGKSLREKGLEMFATMTVLAYLCGHFKAASFSFNTLAVGAAGRQLSSSSSSSKVFEQKMQLASEWTKRTEALLPSLCDRLGVGVNWEVATKHLWAHLFSPASGEQK